MTTTPPPLKIIIVGAGIAGLTLAKALEEVPQSASSPQIEYIVLEGRAELAPQQGAGIALAPGGSRILDQLGVYAELEAQMAPVSSSAMHDVHGKMLLPQRSDAALLVGRRMGYPFGLVERRNVVIALLRGLKRRKECVLTGKKVVSVEHAVDQGKPVRVVCADGSRYEGDLVVGADGVRSRIREEMWGAVEKGICGPEAFDVQRERNGESCLFLYNTTITGVLSIL
jgi:2-polyprenyl-6-methoxyphenol hydroxylase-like FAD-dependent oxidoreductase